MLSAWSRFLKVGDIWFLRKPRPTRLLENDGKWMSSRPAPAVSREAAPTELDRKLVALMALWHLSCLKS